MTHAEAQSLQDFLSQLVAVKGLVRDKQASSLIEQAVAQQPDAAYLLVQRAMLLQQAVDRANAQIRQLQQELAQAQSSGTRSFLDGANAWGNSARTGDLRAVSNAVAPAAPAVMPTPAAPIAATSGSNFFGGNAGSLFANVAATAAGVAGGAFLYQGISHLLGQQQHQPVESGQHAFGSTAAASPPESSGLAADAGINDISLFEQDGLGDGGSDTV